MKESDSYISKPTLLDADVRSLNQFHVKYGPQQKGTVIDLTRRLCVLGRLRYYTISSSIFFNHSYHYISLVSRTANKTP
jgi:hypothetical protein